MTGILHISAIASLSGGSAFRPLSSWKHGTLCTPLAPLRLLPASGRTGTGSYREDCMMLVSTMRLPPLSVSSVGFRALSTSWPTEEKDGT